MWPGGVFVNTRFANDSILFGRSHCQMGGNEKLNSKQTWNAESECTGSLIESQFVCLINMFARCTGAHKSLLFACIEIGWWARENMSDRGRRSMVGSTSGHLDNL